MVEADLAELVDQHGGAGERRVFEQAVEQAGLAGAEEPGEHREGQRRAGPARVGRYDRIVQHDGASVSPARPSGPG